MAKSSSCLADLTSVFISVTLLLVLSMPKIIAQEDVIASIAWTPEGCAQFNAANDGTPVPLGCVIEFSAISPHRVVQISEADYNAGKVDNPIAVLGNNEYGVTIIILEEPGMYYLVSDYPGDFELGYKIFFLAGFRDCYNVNQG